MKSFDAPMKEEQFLTAFAELAAKKILAMHASGSYPDMDDACHAGGGVLKEYLLGLVSEPTFKRVVKNIIPDYNEEFFTDGWMGL